MTRTQTELTYLRAAIESASSVDLVIILYDMLISDLRGAVAAFASNNVERRSEELKHAFLVLEQMEASLNMDSGTEAATSLARFYALLRANIMNGHVKADSNIINRQIEALLEVRATWVEVGRQNAVAAPAASTENCEARHLSFEMPALAGGWSV